MKAVLAEYWRPWKIVTFLIGLGLLIMGSFVFPAPDWDIPISIIMASLVWFWNGSLNDMLKLLRQKSDHDHR
jgi:hypothetical protein